ncbi:MAG: AAA family ATPase [Pyrinomonadaceae bacterium]
MLFPGGVDTKWIVELGVGSSGFKNDFDLATFPGLRRLFAILIDQENGFCKSDFSDIETKLPRAFARRDDLRHLSNTIDYYSKYFSACQVIDDPESDEGKSAVEAFLAAYARTRNWPSNATHRAEVEKALARGRQPSTVDALDEASSLVKERRFVVLQGAPGTGKTRLAKLIATGLNAKVFFTQFHAETSYSDFVHGLVPDSEKSVLTYKSRDGVLASAIQSAISDSSVNTVLIIDEINRANLSNVLGPVFYLFEHQMNESEIEINVTPQLSLARLPKNFFVIATMNTADRSLAVVDFALRRRFAWYTIRPQRISPDEELKFFDDDFEIFDRIFGWFANSSELPLQPGQGYFIAANADEMTNRVRYELYPLISEFLQEGLLRTAKEEFNAYFLKRISRSIFE